MADETLTRREVFSWAAALPHKEDADFILAHDAALRAEVERLDRLHDEACDEVVTMKARAEKAERELAELRNNTTPKEQEVLVLLQRASALENALREIEGLPCNCAGERYDDGSHYHDCTRYSTAVEIAADTLAREGK